MIHHVGVLGGGPAGLVAAKYLNQSGFKATILEAQNEEEYKERFGQNIFFLHNKVDLGIPLREYKVTQMIMDERGRLSQGGNSIFGNKYSKVTTDGYYTCIVHNLPKYMVGYLPKDGSTIYGALRRWAGNVDIKFDHKVFKINKDEKVKKIKVFSKVWKKEHAMGFDYIINTIPISTVLKALGENGNEFPVKKQNNSLYKIKGNETELYQTFYNLSDNYPFFRLQLIKDTVSIESVHTSVGIKRMISYNPAISDFLEKVGVHSIQLEKISDFDTMRFVPIEKEKIRAMVRKLTIDHKIFSLGRFAVWGYKRVDHLFKDAEKIMSWIKMDSDWHF